MRLFALFTLALVGCSAADEGVTQNYATLQTSTIEQGIFDLTNHDRGSFGKLPVHMSSALQSVARAYATQLANNPYGCTQAGLVHNGSLASQIQGATGLSGFSAGENIACGYQDAASVEHGWFDQEMYLPQGQNGHFLNIIGDYQYVGIAVADGPHGKFYVVDFLKTSAILPVSDPGWTPPAGCGRMGSGGQIVPGQSIVSCNGRAILAHQGDGNVVVYDALKGQPTHALWSTATNGRATSTFAMQGDGNLVLYSNTWSPLWYSATQSGGAWLAMQDDCNLVVYSAQNQPIWASYALCH